MSGATSARKAATVPTVDPKLLHVVRKLWMAERSLAGFDIADDETRWYAADVLVRQLQIKHREYQRKDVLQLKTAVANVLEHISLHGDDQSQSTHNDDGDGNNRDTTSVSRRVQKRERALDQEETAYDQAAAARDALSSSNGVAVGGVGGGLNACLRNRYKQVSLDRQHQQALSSTSSGSVTVIDAELTPPHEPLHDHPTGNAIESNSKLGSESKHEASNTNNGTSVTSSSQQRKKVRRSNGRPRVPNLDSDAFNGLDGASSAALVPVPRRPTERYSDLGGLGDVIQTIRQLVEYPIARPELYRHLGVEPPRGVLLRGPPGTYVSREMVSSCVCVVVECCLVVSRLCACLSLFAGSTVASRESVSHACSRQH
jgi:hypothetical protein